MIKRELGTITLRDWQNEIFTSLEWSARLNTIITMPTASGKSVIIDMAITLMEQGRTNCIIIGQPFIALCMETVKYLKKYYPSRNTVSMYSNTHGYPTQGSLVVATYENVCRAIDNCRSITDHAKIELIIDEIHNIYDSSRGSNISEAIVKALYDHQTRIIMMTATLEDDALLFLKLWTNSYHYTTNRGVVHIPIIMICRSRHCSVLNGNEFEQTAVPEEIISGDLIVAVSHILTTQKESHIIVFVNTRDRTRTVSEAICATTEDDNMATPHNALLEAEEKKVIVRMFNSGNVRCIVCTSTLSTGVNLKNVTHVFIAGSSKWNGTVFAPYQRSELYQMCGRVARNGTASGTAYLFEIGNECECRDFFQAFATPSTTGIPKHINNTFAMKMYIKNYPYETNGDPDLHPFSIMEALPSPLQDIDFTSLVSMGEFTHNMVPSVKLAAVARSGLDLVEGLSIFKNLHEHSRSMNVLDEFHLLTMCSPLHNHSVSCLCEAGVAEWPVFTRYITQVGNPLLSKQVRLIQYHKTYEALSQRLGDDNVDIVKTQFASFLVMRWIPGIWQADITVVGPVLDEMMIYADKILRLCLEAHMSLLAVLVEHTAIRLRNGTSGDKNALGCLPSCSRTLARSLLRFNLRYIEQVAGMKVSELAEIIKLDKRRKNHNYNIAIAAKMIKEARRLSFEGSAIVPLTK
jgi:late competence protein required for DNA uptake (superfamily II DNA/RNA helicase)